MSSFIFRFRLNLGLKRLLIGHAAVSAALALLKLNRLQLPTQTLDEFLGRPAPVIPFRQFAIPPMTTGPADLVPLCTLAHAIDARRILEIGGRLGAGTLCALNARLPLRPITGSRITAWHQPRP